MLGISSSFNIMLEISYLFMRLNFNQLNIQLITFTILIWTVGLVHNKIILFCKNYNLISIFHVYVHRVFSTQVYF